MCIRKSSLGGLHGLSLISRRIAGVDLDQVHQNLSRFPAGDARLAGHHRSAQTEANNDRYREFFYEHIFIDCVTPWKSLAECSGTAIPQARNNQIDASHRIIQIAGDLVEGDCVEADETRLLDCTS